MSHSKDWSDDAIANSPAWNNSAKYLLECDRAFAQEVRLASAFKPFSPDVPTVVCVTRNEKVRIKSFLEHYEQLGAKSIHLIDNGSSDDTALIAQAASSAVTVWKTEASYAEAAFGQMWVGGLARRHGLGNWVINVDADELLVYDGMDQHGLSDLQASLCRRKKTRMFTPLVDMYPGPATPKHNESLLLNQAPYFDALSFNGGQPTDLSQLGPRARLMKAIGASDRPCLDKHAVALWHSTTAYGNVHYPYPFEENSAIAEGALLHFKFLDDFQIKVEEALDTRQHWRRSQEYERYRQWLETSETTSLYDPSCSRLYLGPESLIATGLISPLKW